MSAYRAPVAPMIDKRLSRMLMCCVLAALCVCAGCSQKAYWVGPYPVTVRVKPGKDVGITGVVAQAFYKADLDKADNVLGAAFVSNPRYLDLLEMSALKPIPLGNDGAIEVSVMRHGVDRTFPQRVTLKEFRQEKVVLGVYFADGSKNGYVFDVPPPDQSREIIAEIQKGEPGVGADSR